MKRKPVYPFVFALYPVMFLFLNNIDRVPFREVFRVLSAVVFIVALLYLIAGVLLHSWHKAGIITGLVIVIFSSFGHTFRYIGGTSLANTIIGHANFQFAMFAAFVIFITWFVIRKIHHPERYTQPLNIAASALLLILVVQALIKVIPFVQYRFPNANAQSNGEIPQISNTNKLPDIYYIILDEYGRSDVLKEIMSFDNTRFIQYLTTKGFYIADDSHSNYAITYLSLASSLNYTYLDQQSIGMTVRDAYPMIQMIKSSKAALLLKKLGYGFYSFATGYSFTEIKNADKYLEPSGHINEFEQEYLLNTGLAFATDSIIESRIRSITLNTLAGLETLPNTNPGTPKFVFAHILATHAPFVFGPDGEEVTPWAFSPNGDFDRLGYQNAYKQQLTYINKRMMQIIDVILAKSNPKPIIIIQSDHGPQSYLDWYSVDRTCIKERMSIINAYYLPGVDHNLLNPSITPVNTFRVIFDTYFGTIIGRVEDKVYFSYWDTPYSYNDVTDRANECKID